MASVVPEILKGDWYLCKITQKVENVPSEYQQHMKIVFLDVIQNNYNTLIVSPCNCGTVSASISETPVSTVATSGHLTISAISKTQKMCYRRLANGQLSDEPMKLEELMFSIPTSCFWKVDNGILTLRSKTSSEIWTFQKSLKNNSSNSAFDNCTIL